MNTDPGYRGQLRGLCIDANRIASGLYQGSAPPLGYAVRRAGFDVLVYCAEEIQPAAFRHPGVEVLHCPLNDDGSPMRQDEWLRAIEQASLVSRLWRAKKRVLVTCAAGRNRSGLVTALTLYFATPRNGESIVGQIRSSRFHWSGPALTNRYFAEALEALP